MQYEVIDPKGIHVDGRNVQRGRVIPIPEGAALNAFLHFKQVRKREEKPAKPADGPPAPPPGKEAGKQEK
ncbi:hypothetical protein OKA04_12885 [Luteolibacter flavescens]|uniref:Uncharacterized protein n=1 Tax=Luteolibacter flavescens TaxID=1859460 RepID=A0ABT3FPX5_9BACT|nr:hypothetical protein [Luteolibacter flavescens]MCW1885627.1 hypothetical protein [Luteolibacter flavescens]